MMMFHRFSLKRKTILEKIKRYSNSLVIISRDIEKIVIKYKYSDTHRYSFEIFY